MTLVCNNSQASGLLPFVAHNCYCCNLCVAITATTACQSAVAGWGGGGETARDRRCGRARGHRSDIDPPRSSVAVAVAVGLDVVVVVVVVTVAAVVG